MFKRIITIVTDSVGIGHSPDAERFGDTDANTLGHIEEAVGPLQIPNLRKLGISRIADITPQQDTVVGAFGRMHEQSTGKDTTSGHWEMMGHPVKVPFPTFYDGFPQALMDTFTKETGYGFLGNEAASGTEIIERLGEEHMRTGKPIVYTSADSVFQIAAHESIIPLEDLYKMCQITRERVCIGDYYVGRIIARPFVGEPGRFVRTSNRHDYSRLPEGRFVLQALQDAKVPTIGVGKIGDIYAHIGLDQSFPTKSNSHGMNLVAALLGHTADGTHSMQDTSDTTLEGRFTHGYMMVNLVEFDSLYGHRRDVQGYGRELEMFDYQLGGLLELLTEDDLLLIAADHGNDPTWKGTDHTRELVPLLAYSPSFTGPIDLGDRRSFADIGQTILKNFGVKESFAGESFLQLLAK
ncbi:phosphopentomutase [Veillonella sp. oral taxon 780]|uniref:phosphopentomutase n=1 Tax=Veillonella sp. oral taxon 780 TaxID=671229 RepID=UPI00021A1AC4|nr:phosphopentomutase [Veillonella sp. oral taxon 780]EGS33838.1 phosphopentomutase [Veillonella sp. oral taxon 780 str. F0422]